METQLRELDTVVLVRDLATHDFTQGDVGVAVHVYHDDATLEVEFVTGEGLTIAVLTLTEEDTRPMHAREILHVRELSKHAKL